MKQEGHQL